MMRILTLPLFALLLGLANTTMAAEVVDIGDQNQVFIDGWFIQDADGVASENLSTEEDQRGLYPRADERLFANHGAGWCLSCLQPLDQRWYQLASGVAWHASGEG